MPDWVTTAVNEYSKRLQEIYALNIIEIPLIKRTKSSDLSRIFEKEMKLMEQAIPTNAYLVALDIQGQAFSSEALAIKFNQLQQITSHICFFIGGPEGLSPFLIQKCQERWSLSKLTLPHPFVRIMFLEVLYRVWSINNNHPYHK